MQPEEVLKIIMNDYKDAGLIKTQEEELEFREHFWSTLYPPTPENRENLK